MRAYIGIARSRFLVPITSVRRPFGFSFLHFVLATGYSRLLGIFFVPRRAPHPLFSQLLHKRETASRFRRVAQWIINPIISQYVLYSPDNILLFTEREAKTVALRGSNRIHTSQVRTKRFSRRLSWARVHRPWDLESMTDLFKVFSLPVVL